MKDIVWTTEQIALGELVEWEKNPVQLSAHDAEQIQISLRKFGLVLPLVANKPASKNGARRLIDGHQRKTILMFAEMADEETLLDVRTPSRKLTVAECDELSVRLRRNTGGFDYDILANDFEVDDLLEWGFEQHDLEIHGFDFDLPDLPEPDEDIAGSYIVYVSFESFETFAAGLDILSLGGREALEGTKYSALDGDELLAAWMEKLE